MEFNKKFKSFLKKRGVTAKDVGILLGYSEAMMSRYTNAAKPNIEFIDRLIKQYPDIDLNWLLKEDETLNMVAEDIAVYNTTSVVLLKEIKSKIDGFLTDVPQK